MNECANGLSGIVIGRVCFANRGFERRVLVLKMEFLGCFLRCRFYFFQWILRTLKLKTWFPRQILKVNLGR